ncbi:overexpressed in colon carcinoma 1 protein-like [Gadus macrocephalus]|uniref:overexpressed in colon carcinoma 1 protein-like n=1 Tax=Gadus macrocephalus TaxID=80720 RepID=UPI0028CB146D|nr:overexpressed in colon carcinoma 1 protein-like [Gadus macrocephalus]XP_059905489.1 overexpressed in colon carcinoma 1 protein-like [Gadus macrocephalus]
MGCGNSSAPAAPSCSGDGSESSKHATEEVPEEDEEKRRDYGGVYVGLPTDLSNVPQVQIGALRDYEKGGLSLQTPLWRDGIQA